MCTSSRYSKGFVVGKVRSPGGSESQVPSIQDRGSITGFSWGVSVEEEERMKKENSGICALQLAASCLQLGGGEHKTPQKCFFLGPGQLQTTKGERELRAVMESRSSCTCALGSHTRHTRQASKRPVSDSCLWY